MNRTTRKYLLAGLLIVIISLLGWVGYGFIDQNSRVTADKLRNYENSTDLATLSGAERAEALHKLEEKINALSLDERRKSRLGPEWRQWFDKMTEAEKGQFIEATLPSGFKQWLAVFDNLPQDKRKDVVEAAIKKLKTTHQLGPLTEREPGADQSMYGTNGAPPLSPSLWQKAETIGLRTFFSESSAEVKAQIAPFLEELQRQMQSGKLTQ